VRVFVMNKIINVLLAVYFTDMSYKI